MEHANSPAKKYSTFERPEEVHREWSEEIVQVEQRERLAMSLSDRLADKITAFSGSMVYVWLHVFWFAGWILLNRGWFGLKPFDPFPFSVLTMMVSLEAIFLSAFVLISQNKQAVQADKRAKIDLQVNMMAERETTKILIMLEEMQQQLELVKKSDSEVTRLQKKTNIHHIADALDRAEEHSQGSPGGKSESTADSSR
ncbi:MAG TPA: DUF1003 domain-containing protein [Ktedonobacteraceae bacterium]